MKKNKNIPENEYVRKFLFSSPKEEVLFKSCVLDNNIIRVRWISNRGNIYTAQISFDKPLLDRLNTNYIINTITKKLTNDK